MTFTLAEIEDHWKVYSKSFILKYLQGGKWNWMPMKRGMVNMPGNITRAEQGKLSDVMSFPEYLKRIEDGKKA